MKQEIQELKGLMKECQARLEHLEKKTEETNFEVGKWYKATRPNWNNWIINFQGISDGCMMAFGLSDNKDWYGNQCWSSDYENWNITEATHSEIESALIAEAKRRGFKKGVEIRSFVRGTTPCFCSSNEWIYDPEKDILNAGGAWVYKKGQWAEIIKEEKIDIGGYQVKFSEHTRDTKIDGHLFTKEFWQAAKLISEHNKAKIMVGCSKQFDVSLETINRILDKLK